MIRVLFICHGNICRSTMAQFVFQDMVNKRGLSDQFTIDSKATSTEELASQLSRSDYDKFDYIIGMDTWNMKNINRILGGDPEGKVSKLLAWSGDGRDIADPWYTGNFDETYDDVLEGCEAFLTFLLENGLLY